MKKINIPGFLLLLAICFGSQTAFAQAPDPSQRGPFATTNEEYNLGNTAFTPSGFPAAVELRAVVFRPTDLTKGPYPIVLFMHGRHSTCFFGSSSALEWPCTGFRQPIPSFRGYDYAADVLASHGYFVVSISANGINARDQNTADLGAFARAQLIQRHLDLWRQFNSTGGTPFGNKFVGKVDLTRVGTMGHSRGGEGVLRHFLFNNTQPSPYPIKVIVPIAPTNFSRWQVNNGVAVAQLLSYCDGDVTNIQGLHAYDDARYQIFSSGYQQYVAVMGGNHNYYNVAWTPGNGFPASDDWGITSDPFCGTVSGNGRLTAAQQRAVATAYLPAFFRSEVGGESVFRNLIDGSKGRPPSVSALNLHVSFQGPDPKRLDLNRLLNGGDLFTNFLGGSSSQAGLAPHDLCGGDFPQPQHCLSSQPSGRQPHTEPSPFSSLRGLSQLRTGWSSPGAVYVNDIPPGPGRDISGFQYFQFRATVNFGDFRNPSGQPQDLRVRFTDENGASQLLRVGQFSNALFFPPGTSSAVPKVWQNTVRVPLTFLTGVDKTRVVRVEFLFDQRASGALLISDLHFYKTENGEIIPASNVALQATASASSQNNNTQQQASKAIDGVIDGHLGSPGDVTKEWATTLQGPGAWLRLDWSGPQRINQVVLYDRPNPTDQVLSGTLTFSDGSSINVGTLNNAGAPMSVVFPQKTVTWVMFTINTCTFHNIGLAEMQVLGVPAVSNVALQATASASSENTNTQQHASKAIDDVIDGHLGVPGDFTKEWASILEGPGAWLRLDWSTPQRVNRILLFDRPNPTDHILSGTLTFSDGSSISVGALNNNGVPVSITFPEKNITWVMFTITACNFSNIGLTEIQVYGFQ